jgi:hypothetical protein
MVRAIRAGSCHRSQGNGMLWDKKLVTRYRVRAR